MKNIAASIRAKLTNISKKEKIAFQVICTRYFHERLLYRLSVSKYTDNLILKGGGLLYYFNRLKTRPTLDIDFSGQNIDNQKQKILQVFKEICKLTVQDDGLIYDSESIESEQINEQANYTGLRLYITVFLGQIKHRLQIDIGFGDIITPNAVQIEYPILLEQNEIPQIKAYTKETVIAEKFQTMIELSGLNSRMKDFYDVYNLLKTQEIDKIALENAIKNTFSLRKTTYMPNHHLFSAYFIDDVKQKQWGKFIQKAVLNESLKLKDVIELIKNELKPIWDNMNN